MFYDDDEQQIAIDVLDGIHNAREHFLSAGAFGCAIAWLRGGRQLASEPYVDEDGWYAMAADNGRYTEDWGTCRPVLLLEGNEDEGKSYIEDAVEAVNAFEEQAVIIEDDYRQEFFDVSM